MKRLRTFCIFCFLSIAIVSYGQSIHPLAGLTIMLDPGHGGADPGAVGPTGLKESDVNLRVARYLRQLLEADGTQVLMTRETDRFLSLAERVALAKKHNPDLFVSIHHNASLRPVLKNRSEIYYSAQDHGISQKLGKKMTDHLLEHGFGEESLIIPAGFFVLRNNTVPAILTEAGFMSLPEIEKQLKTGKALTNQALALRNAIREYYKDGYMRVKFFVAEGPVKINTPFFNLIFAANKPVKTIHARLNADKSINFGFDKLPSVGQTYRFYNTQALSSGKYELQLTFTGTDDSSSSRTILTLEVDLPIDRSELNPVAPYIPTGFKGKFPLRVTLKDNLGRQNTRVLPVAVFYGEDSIATSVTNESGEATVYLDLNGNERDSIEARLVLDKQIYAKTYIPVRIPSRKFFLGQIKNDKNEGLGNVKILYGLKESTYSCSDGHFFCDAPLTHGNLQIDLLPPPGYPRQSAWLRGSNVPVSIHQLTIKAEAPALLGKKIAIMAPIALDEMVRPLVKHLMNAGVKPLRLPLPADQARPEYQAVLEANLRKDLDLLISFKQQPGNAFSLRHYHRGGRGKIIAEDAQKRLLKSINAFPVKVSAGSDYEISHTGITAIVFALPKKLENMYYKKLADSLFETLRNSL